MSGSEQVARNAEMKKGDKITAEASLLAVSEMGKGKEFLRVSKAGVT